MASELASWKVRGVRTLVSQVVVLKALKGDSSQSAVGKARFSKDSEKLTPVLYVAISVPKLIVLKATPQVVSYLVSLYSNLSAV